VWKEVVEILRGGTEVGEASAFSDHYFIFVCAVLPLLVAFSDIGLRLVGMDRPIEKLFLEKWVKSTFNKLVAERGLAEHPAIADVGPIYTDGQIFVPGLQSEAR
jgi:hypothetical protein